MKIEILFIYLTFISCYATDSTLQLVHVFFRHGSRAPTRNEMYPTSPHKDFWMKIGFGQLTNVGREESFKLGQILRQRYKSFLPEDYNSEEVITRSTDYNRTRQTASLVLKGMFSSSNISSASYVVFYKNYNEDFKLRGVFKYCPAYTNETDNIVNSPHIREIVYKHKNIFELISQKTNQSYKSLLDVFFLFQSLYSEKYINLSIPQWAETLYERMEKIAGLQFHIENYNTKLKRLNGGRMLKQVIENMKAKSKDPPISTKAKVFLYSAHDVNVVNILATMGVFKPHFPNYNAATILELHYNTTSRSYYVTVFYISHVHKEAKEMILKECGHPCNLTQFEEVMSPYIPINYTQECESKVLLDENNHFLT